MLEPFPPNDDQEVIDLIELVIKMSAQLDRLEATLNRFMPMLSEAERRMAPAMRWRRDK